MSRTAILALTTLFITGCSGQEAARSVPAQPPAAATATVSQGGEQPSNAPGSPSPDVVAEAAQQEQTDVASGYRKVVPPPQGVPWQVQYSGTPVLDGAKIMNVDGADSSQTTVYNIHQSGAYAICYINAGAYENWRADANRFTADVLGADMDDWQGEKWLDVRRLDVLLPIMRDRIDDCARKGFNAVDPDNVDGWQNDSGFPLTKDDSVRYVNALAKEAHSRGMAISLKNAVNMIPDVVDNVDFAVNEECVAEGECASYRPFLDRGKAVLHVEYEGDIGSICAERPANFSTVLKNLSLDSSRKSC